MTKSVSAIHPLAHETPCRLRTTLRPYVVIAPVGTYTAVLLSSPLWQ